MLIDQCAGTLVIHVDGGYTAECTEPDCVDLDELRHTLIVDCTALSGGCSCLESRVIARAS